MGILALWNDCQAGSEALYEAWYQGEHLPERLGIPGFLRGRRYQAIRANKQYFTWYEVTTPAVLTSAAYLERVNNPTKLTTQVMSGILTGISRTVCRRVALAGNMRGAVAVTAQLREPPAEPARSKLLSMLTTSDGVARAECWESAETGNTKPTTEEALRGSDDKISACVLVEVLREADAPVALEAIASHLGDTMVDSGTYRLMCELANDQATD